MLQFRQLLLGPVGDVLVGGKLDLAAMIAAVGGLRGPHKGLRAPALEARAHAGRRAGKGLAVDAARERIVGMRVDVVDAAFRRHLIDRGNVAVGIVDDGAGLDAVAPDPHRIVVGQQLARVARRIAVVRRGDGVDDLRDGLAHIDVGIDEIAAAGNGVAARRVADVPGVAERRHRRRIGEGQPVLPGVIGAQHIGKVGAVGIKVHADRVGGAEERVRGREIRGRENGTLLVQVETFSTEIFSQDDQFSQLRAL